MNDSDSSEAAEVTRGSCGEHLTWSYDAETGALTITGTGAMKDFTYAETKWGGNVKSVSLSNGPTSIGNNAFRNCTSLTSVTIPDSVKSINEGAFQHCPSLTSITIPNSVTSLGDYAFWGCTSLTSVTIPDSVVSIGNNAFWGCTSLTSVTIGNSVTSIGDSAFSGCTSLTSVTIPDSVTSIGSYAFSCHSLASISVGESNTAYSTIGGVLFNKSKTTLIYYPKGKADTAYAIPNSVTSIEDNAFRGCTSLSSVTIPDSVTSIANYAFRGCTSLSSVTIPDSVTSIENYAFYGCTSLTSVTIGNSVTSIGDSAFSGCTSLTSVTIPDSVTSIEYSAFAGCTSLTSVTIPDSVTYIGNYAFSGCISLASITVGEGNSSYCSENGILFDKSKTILIQYPAGKADTTYSIPDSVTSIESSAFARCISLASITVGEGNSSYCSENGILFDKSKTILIKYPAGKADTTYSIPDSVTSIRGNAFSGCVHLVSVSIPDSFRSIGDYAFSGCASLVSVTIPYTVKTIGSYAFSECTSLDSISLPYNVTSISSYAFKGCNSLTSVRIGDSVSVIDSSAFDGCTNLATINVSINNKSYSTLYNVLFNKSKTTLILYPAGKTDTTYTIPNSVTSIRDNAFRNCTSLTSVTIPDSVTSIGYSAFYGCTSLTSITIGNSVKFIDDYAFSQTFYDCDGTTKLYPAAENLAGHTFVIDKGKMILVISSILFDTCGGSELQSVRGVQGDPVTEPSPPTRNGYTFSGWYSDEGCTTQYTFTVLPEGSVTVYAKWTPIEYSILYNLEDGTLDNTISGFTIESLPIVLPEPVKAHYSFLGWYDGKVQGNKITVIPTGTIGNQELYARWSPTTYTVTFNDGTVTTKKEYTIEDMNVTAPAVTPKGHYTGAWEQYSLNFEDITVKAVYTPITYILIFDDGTKSTEVGYTIETEEIREPTITKLKGKSGEWEDYTLQYTTNQKVQAVYTAGIFKVSFLVDGVLYQEYKMAYGNMIELPATNPSKVADVQYTYTFDGWNGYTSGMTVADEDMVFEARFSKNINVYEITFTVDGSSKTSKMEYGSVITLPEVPTRESTVDTVYAFKGWKGYSDGMTVSGDAEFTAEFTESLRCYNIVFLYDNGNAISETKIGYGLPIETPSAEKESTAQYDFSFLGWVDANGSAIAVPATVSGDFTAYASYTENLRQYTVSFVSGGEEYAKFVLYYGNAVVVPSEVPAKESDADFDYAFSGWNGYTDGMKVTGEASFTAEFSKNVKVKESTEGGYSVEISDNSASFTPTTVSNIVEKAKADTAVTMSVSLGSGVITFDNAALQTLKDEGSDLVVNQLDKSQMTASVGEIVGDNVAYSITFGNNKTFGNGKVTVTLPYTLESGKDADKLMIYYIADGRVAEEIQCLYNDGYVTFVTDHFSTYAIMYLDPESPGSEFPIMYAAIGAIAVLALAGGAIVVKKRKA